MISQDNLPYHWDYLPLHSIFNERRESNKNLELDFILSLVKDVGIMPYTKKGDVGNKSKDDLSQYKIARINDLVLNKMNAVIGSLGVSNYNGLVSPIYLVLALKDKNSFNIHYFGYFFQIKPVQESLAQYAYGIMKIRESIDYLEFKKMKLPVPPIEEQNKIVDFIDQKSTQIEKFIQNKTRFIDLLKEQKEAVINEAVTKGLDSSVKLKDSGIEWLGEIPKHWEVRKLKYVAKCLFSNVDKHTHENETEVFLCNYTDVYKNDTITNNLEFMKATATDDEIRKFLLLKDDVIITKDSETPDDMAVPTYVSENLNNVLCGYHLAIIRAKKGLFGKFLYFLFMSTDFNIRFEIYSNGVTRYGLGNFIVNNSKIPLPPYEEQLQIVEYIDNELNQIDKLIEKTTKQIELIKEYKTSLINEAVSGKIKVC
jgi:type I restriction enzyme S subunit